MLRPSEGSSLIPVASRVYVDGVEHLLLLLLHLDCNVEAPAGPAEHLCQQNGLHHIQPAILACTKNGKLNDKQMSLLPQQWRFGYGESESAV